MAGKKQNRLRFTIGNHLQDDVDSIENYYGEPVSKLLLDKIIVAVKEKADTVPEKYRVNAQAHH